MNSTTNTDDGWTFWNLIDENDAPDPDGWKGAYNHGPAGEVWHSGGNHWNRTWVNPWAGVEITTLINSPGEMSYVRAWELEDHSPDDSDPEYLNYGEPSNRYDAVSVDYSGVTADKGTPDYYRQVDAAQIEAVTELLRQIGVDL